MRLTTSLMKLEKQNLNAIGNSMKVSQLMRFGIINNNLLSNTQRYSDSSTMLDSSNFGE